jgi:hypothetical protein
MREAVRLGSCSLNGKRVEAQRKEDLDDFMSAHKVCGVLSEIKVVMQFCTKQGLRY